MKGPRSRHRFCVLRAWECPVCKKRITASVQTVNRDCVCQGKDRPTWMRLIEESRVRPQRMERSALAADRCVGFRQAALGKRFERQPLTIHTRLLRQWQRNTLRRGE